MILMTDFQRSDKSPYILNSLFLTSANVHKDVYLILILHNPNLLFLIFGSCGLQFI